MPTEADLSGILLPEGTRLVHIGPPKTGTTSLQAAFHASRPDLASQGVRYAGRTRHSVGAALAAVGRPYFWRFGGPPPISRWHALLREIRNAPEARVVLSSEGLAEAKPDAIRRIVDDLDPTRVHIVVTLRPLPRILASHWQQRVRGGLHTSFDAWLEVVLGERGQSRDGFWHLQRHDRLIARWADVVGPERLTVVVVDDRNHDFVLRVFEQLLGLREGTLVAVPDTANRSLTYPEIEAIRDFSLALHEAGLGNRVFDKVVRRAAVPRLQQRVPAADEPRIEAPQWALDQASQIAREMVVAIAASGVRVVGDLDSLAAPHVSKLAGDRQPEVCLSPSIATAVAMGVVEGSGLARKAAKGEHLLIEPSELRGVPTRRVAAVLFLRGRAAGYARLRRLRRGVRRRVRRVRHRHP